MKEIITILKSGIAFLLSVLAFSPSRNLGMAASLPVEPTADNELVPSLAVAKAIKPTESVGNIAVGLLNAKNTSEERKIVILKPADGAPCRVLMFPTTVSDATALANESLLATIGREDETKESSSHLANIAGGSEADETALRIVAFTEYPAPAENEKPKRALAALLNGLSDAIDAWGDEETSVATAITFTQEGAGSVKVYLNAVAGTLTGAVGDVQQVEAEAAVANPLW